MKKRSNALLELMDINEPMEDFTKVKSTLQREQRAKDGGRELEKASNRGRKSQPRQGKCDCYLYKHHVCFYIEYLILDQGHTEWQF